MSEGRKRDIDHQALEDAIASITVDLDRLARACMGLHDEIWSDPGQDGRVMARLEEFADDATKAANRLRNILLMAYDPDSGRG